MLQGLRRSSSTAPNPNLQEIKLPTPAAGKTSARSNVSNLAWIEQVGITHGVLLIGGTSIAAFRLRIAQSELRPDMLPSYWSSVGLLVDGKEIITVDLDRVSDVSAHVERNGVERIPLKYIDDAVRFPNIALIEFTPRNPEVVDQMVRIGRERNIVDLLAQVSEWLPYLWGIPGSNNPLLKGIGIPSATLVERAHGMVGSDLSPGLASAASCPEAIWQAARWWHESITSGKEDGAYPKGSYSIRQVSAAAVGIRDDVVDSKIVGSNDEDPLFKYLSAMNPKPKAKKRAPKHK